MGLPLFALKKIAPYLPGARVLSLAYPDFTVTPQELKDTLGITPTQFTDRGAAHALQYKLPESCEVFAALGCSFDCVDIVRDVGCERIVDLNYEHDLGKHDLVLDPGTLEHCFNIGQALFNAANAVAVGGRIYHISPMAMMNHGFWNICPTLYHDFYKQNDWEVEALEPVVKSTRMSDTGRFYAHAEHMITCLARRRTDAALKFPTQAKYVTKMAKKPLLLEAA